jgi:hypothetical protein
VIDIISEAIPIAEAAYGKTVEALGSGYNGTAYLLENGTVLKLTTCALEATTVNFLRELQSIDPVLYIDGIVEYYSKAHIVTGTGADSSSVFAYSMERVKGVTREQANAIPKYNLPTEAEDTPPSNAFFHAYRAVHSENTEKDAKKRAKYHRVYLENLMKCASVPGYENATQAIVSLATSSSNGGPFLVGDFKPLNCGLPMNGSTEVKAFDLYVYNVPNTKRFIPVKL